MPRSSYIDTFQQHLRICLLRLLDELPDYTSNNSMLADGARAFGLMASRDQIDGQINWLREQGLLEVNQLTEDLCTVTLTERGQDVANGRATVPGVKRPGPKG